MINSKKIEECVRGIIEALGDDTDREGLIETPRRVAGMCEEVFEGMNYTNAEIAGMFNKTFENPNAAKNNVSSSSGTSASVCCESDDDAVICPDTGMVTVKDIEVFSYCEHHLALMYNMKVSVAYIPTDRVIGLSKIARIADMAAKRLQLQERIGSDIAEIMQMVTGSDDIAVFIEANHSCMTARGIKNTSAKTVTSTLLGRFQTDDSLYLRARNM